MIDPFETLPPLKCNTQLSGTSISAKLRSKSYLISYIVSVCVICSAKVLSFRRMTYPICVSSAALSPRRLCAFSPLSKITALATLAPPLTAIALIACVFSSTCGIKVSVFCSNSESFACDAIPVDTLCQAVSQ